MSNPFTARRPWAAGLIAFFLGPFIGMLYLGRGRLALLFFALGLVAAVILIAFLPQLIASGVTPDSMWLAELPVTLAGTIYAVVLARRRDVRAALPWFSRWYTLLAFILVPPLLALGVRTFLYQPFNAPTASMSPSVNPGDFFMVSKFAYTSQPPARGEIAAFYVPRKDAIYIKRIVGLPGERIQMRGGLLFIDGKEVPRRRVEDFVETDMFDTVQHIAQYEETLPGGRRDRVLDRGTTVFDDTNVFVVPPDSYFVLGDNRDNSDDSRATIGFVTRKDLIGPIAYKYVSGGRWVWEKLD